MTADIRFPIGLLFTIVGVIISVWGFATRGWEMYARHSLGINVNIWTGICLTIFGVLMLIFALRGHAADKAAAKSGQQ